MLACDRQKYKRWNEFQQLTQKLQNRYILIDNGIVYKLMTSYPKHRGYATFYRPKDKQLLKKRYGIYSNSTIEKISY